MNAKSMIKYSLVLAISLLTACNGGIGGTGSKGGGGTKKDISVGTVTATGSVQVNGVTFNTTSATVTIDEIPVSEAALKQGMVVEVRGSIDSETAGTADTVAAEAVVKGPITNMLAGNPNQIAVLKQLVLLDAATILVVPGIPAPTLTDFTNSDLVEVSGFVKASGVIAATRIEKKTVLNDYKLKGVITGTLGTTFKIGNQLVDYSGLGSSAMPDGVPADGWFVEVKASIPLGGSGELIATRIELESIRNSEGSKIELEGYVTKVTSTSGTLGIFFIGSQEIQTTNGSTIFTGGLLADIRLGVEIEVEGQITGGVLIADEVEFDSNVEVEADTLIVDAANGTLSLDVGGMSGLVVVTNENTEISTLDPAGNNLLSDLAAGGGNYVDVRGNYDAVNKNIIATRIEEKTADVKILLQGPVTGESATTIEIMGITVDPAAATLEDQDEASVIDFATFLTMVSVDSIVKAEGTQVPPILWEKLSLEY